MIKRIELTALMLAQRFIGVREIPGHASNPLVLAMLKLDSSWVEDDETPWCSAFVNAVAWLLDLPRSKSLAARSWLTIGTPIRLEEAVQGFDVVVLSRGASSSAGHVGFYLAHDASTVTLVGGNQGDKVCAATFDKARVIGVRRIFS